MFFFQKSTFLLCCLASVLNIRIFSSCQGRKNLSVSNVKKCLNAGINHVTFVPFGQLFHHRYRDFNINIYISSTDYNNILLYLLERSSPDIFSIFFRTDEKSLSPAWNNFKIELKKQIFEYADSLGYQETFFWNLIQQSFQEPRYQNWFRKVFLSFCFKTYTFKTSFINQYEFLKFFRKTGIILQIPCLLEKDKISTGLRWYLGNAIKLFPQTLEITFYTVILNYFIYVMFDNPKQIYEPSIYAPVINIGAINPDENYISQNQSLIMKELRFVFYISDLKKGYFGISSSSLKEKISFDKSEPTLIDLDFFLIKNQNSTLLQVYTEKKVAIFASSSGN